MNISEKENLDTALKYHSAGELEKAESIYLEILKSSPNNYNVLNCWGL